MPYNKTNWKDTIKDASGNVIEKGTPLAAQNLNKMESGIENATQNAEKAVSDLAVVSQQLADTEEKASLVPLFTVKQNRVTNILTTFQNGHGFVKQSPTGTQTDDTTDFSLGSQSLKLKTPGDGTTVFSRKTNMGPFDATGKQVKVTFKIKNVRNASQFQVYLFTSGGTANFFTASPIELPAQRLWVNENEWSAITVNFGNMSSFGMPDRSNITGIQIRIIDNGAGVPVELNINSVAFVDEPSQGVISITMDDGWLTQYTEGRRIMDKYGFTATAYIISDIIGTSPDRWMSIDDLKKLRDVNGWEIAAHAGEMTAHEAKFDTLTSKELNEDMRILRNWLVSNGFQSGAGHLAYPGGGYNADTLAVMRKMYSSARSISAGNHETYPPADPHRLRIYNVLNTLTMEYFKEQVDKCFNNKTWLILCYHQFTDPATASTQVTPANFEQQMAYIASKGVPVRNVGDVIRYGI